MALDLIAFIAGVIYGYMSPGKEDRVKLLKKGLRIGIIVGLALAILNLLVGGILSFGATLVGSIIGIGFLTLIFVVGTIVGDWLERKAK